jgi:hypothetical protein
MPNLSPLDTGMNIIRNIPYRKIDGDFLHVDLYEPEIEDGTLLIYMADGVNRSQMDSRILYRLLAADYAVATLSYRDIEDCRYGIHWLQTNLADGGLITDNIALWGFGSGGFIALQLGLQGEADAVCAMQVDFPKTGLHEAIADNPAAFLMLQSVDHPNMKHIRRLDNALRDSRIKSHILTLSSSELSDTAVEKASHTMLNFYSKWI